MPVSEPLISIIINMPLEKIQKIGGGLGSNQRLDKTLNKKLISCAKYRKK